MRRALWCLLCLLPLLPVGAARATTVRYMNLSELVRASDTIVFGRAGAHDSFWQGTRIYTRVEVAVEEVWVGRTPRTKTIDVITLGGVVGTIGQHVEGVAPLPEDTRVVLHLKARSPGEYVPVALAQGVWHVQAPAASGIEPRLSRPSPDRVVFAQGQIPEAAPQTLAQLKAAILEAARER
jgi:hypothetical protein